MKQDIPQDMQAGGNCVEYRPYTAFEIKENK